MNNTSKALQGQVMQYGELVSPSVAAELDQGGEERTGEEVQVALLSELCVSRTHLPQSTDSQSLTLC